MPKPKKLAVKPALALVFASEEAMLGGLNRLITLRLKLAKARTKLEVEVAKLQSAFDEDPDHAADRAELAQLETSVHLFATNHREALFKDGLKSIEYSTATIGFRLNPVSVDKKLPKDTFEAITLRLAELDWGDPYVDWKPTLLKEDLKRDRANFTQAQLDSVGLAFKQEEQFYIEPKSDLLERSTKPAEAAAA